MFCLTTSLSTLLTISVCLCTCLVWSTSVPCVWCLLSCVPCTCLTRSSSPLLLMFVVPIAGDSQHFTLHLVSRCLFTCTFSIVIAFSPEQKSVEKWKIFWLSAVGDMLRSWDNKQIKKNGRRKEGQRSAKSSCFFETHQQFPGFSQLTHPYSSLTPTHPHCEFPWQLSPLPPPLLPLPSLPLPPHDTFCRSDLFFITRVIWGQRAFI